jgi:molybdate transport system substrate-binding protein
VAAAANLQFAITEIETRFEQRHPELDLQVTLGSSGSLFAQLSQRAPFDIFFSADTVYPRRLVATGFVAEEDYFVYAQGRIVVWVRNDSSLDVERDGLSALLDPSVRKIAIANPQLAPYGAAARSALEKRGVYDQLRERLVLGDNLAQTAHFVESGAADAGIIGLALAVAPRMKARGRYAVIPGDAYEPIEQAGVVLAASDNAEAARLLRAFVTSEEGRKILQDFGYSGFND